MAEFVPSANKLSFDANSFQGSNQTTGKMHGFKSLSFKVDVDGETKSLNMKSYMSEGSETIKTVSYVVLSSDESVKPDQATENTGILDYQLLDNEFLVKVERFGKPSNQIGDPKQVFVETGRSWDIYTNNEDPVLVEVTFAQGKEPKVQGLTFYSDDYENAYGIGDDGVRRGLTSITWKGGVFKCEPVSLETKVLDLTNFPMLSMRYKHDGTVYELDTNKLVKTYGNQNIDGKKVFKSVPQVQGTPVAADDVVNKAYVEENFIGTSSFDTGKSSVTGLVKGSNKGGSYCGFSYFKWLLKDGTRLDLKMVENVTANNATTPVLAVWHVVKDLGSQITAPEKKSKAEIEGYQLQEGEFKGTLSYFKVVGKYNVYTGEPWASYIGSGITDQHEGLLGFAINDLVSPLKAIEFTVGNKGESWQYAFDTLQVTGKNGSKEYDVTYPKKAVNNEVVTVELPFSSVPDFVTVQTEQTITGKKVFSGSVQSSLEPKADADLVTLAYANKKFLRAASNGDVTIQLECDMQDVWLAISELKVLLQNGKRLEPKFLEKVTVHGHTDPVLVVFGINDNPDATVVRPADKTRDEIEQYTLGENEFLAELTYAEGIGPCQSHTSNHQSCLWDAYLANGINSKEEAPLFKLVIKALTYELKGIKFKPGDKYNTFYYKSSFYRAFFGLNNGPSETVETKDIQSEITLEVPSGTLVVEQNNSGYVDLTSAQEITGVKTFAKAPKCLADAVDDNDLVTKAYVDSKSSSVDKLPVQEITVFTKAASNNTILMNYLLLDTVDGTHVDPIYYEKQTYYNNLQKPLRVIFSVNAKRYVSSSYTSVSPTEMESRDMDSYVLKAGEFMGSISLPNLVSGGKVNFVGTSDNLPWFHLKVTTNGATEDTPIFKIKIEGKLPAVAKASFQADTTYPGEDFKLAVAAGGITKESEVKRAVAGAVLNLTCTEVPIYEDYYVNTVANQSIMGTKVFKSAPQYLNLAPVARNNGDNLVNFANLASSIGIAVPEKQILSFYVEGTQSKHNAGGAKWNYSWSMNVKFENLVPAFIDPLTGKITPLYIKHYCSDGRAILTTKKPSVEFDKASVTSKSSDEMDSYTLAKGEYLCKAYWYFLAKYQNTDINGTYIKNHNICGSKVLDLFTTSSAYWKEYQSGQFSDASSYVSPSSSLYVEFYNTPEIRYVRVYGVSCKSVGHFPFGLEEGDKATQAKGASASLSSSIFQELGEYQRENFALNAPTSPVEMLPVAPIVANMQATIEKLEARIKTLEDAAKP